MVYYGAIIGLSVILYCMLRFGMKYRKKRADDITITFFFLSYLLLLCLRDESVGADIKSYSIRFTLLQNLRWPDLFSYANTGVEIGYSLLNKVVGLLGGFRLFLIVVSAIIVLPVLYLYRHEAEDAVLCIAFFLVTLLFGMFFSGLRQSIAIALGVFAFYCAKNRKKILFILIVLLAFTFHRTAILLLALYPVYHARITKKWLWFVIPILLLIYIYRVEVFKFVSRYLEGSVYTYYTLLTGTSGQFALSVLFVLLSVYSFVMMDETFADSECIGTRNILLLATTIHLFSSVNPVVARTNMYFILFIPVAITKVNSRCKKKYRQIEIVATLAMEAYFIAHFLMSSGSSTRFEEYMFFFKQ